MSAPAELEALLAAAHAADIAESDAYAASIRARVEKGSTYQPERWTDEAHKKHIAAIDAHEVAKVAKHEAWGRVRQWLDRWDTVMLHEAQGRK